MHAIVIAIFEALRTLFQHCMLFGRYMKDCRFYVSHKIVVELDPYPSAKEKDHEHNHDRLQSQHIPKRMIDDDDVSHRS